MTGRPVLSNQLNGDTRLIDSAAARGEIWYWNYNPGAHIVSSQVALDKLSLPDLWCELRACFRHVCDQLARFMLA
ncbi:hypothetical protein [Novosphingobium sp. PP1Y]|uniref:hypothetical protein n=1 Tax=Novosphingobium sp. PP1Y TaxID=702113 RepID=UPI0005A21938|nr:hypothetical protein [Novosphingobium sp. PP1Y]